MLFFIVFLSVIFFLVCSIYFLRIKGSDNRNKAELIQYGARLIFYSGLFLVSLKILDSRINFVPLLDQMCQDLLDQHKFEQYELSGCQLNNSVLGEAGKELTSSVINALSWLIPLMFAAVGVNVLAHGLLMPGNNNEITEDKIVSWLPNRFQRAVRWLLSQLP